jgi:DNA (cytosine-5)-methyltransferase 1
MKWLAMSRAYYNEIDPYAAQWLRNLIDAGHIARGDVDERSIADLKPGDLGGYTQAHFFAGIGGWSVALRLAGWPDDRPVWTGSCPCQPFSSAGKGEAANDERHLWPTWFSLVAECRPPVVFGEQVEAAIGWGWLDAVFADLEGEGYACGATVLPACGVGAPHIRNRTWFVADASGPRAGRDIGDAQRQAPEGNSEGRQNRRDIAGRAVSHGATGDVGHTDDTGSQGWPGMSERADQRAVGAPSLARFWDAELIPCTDGKARPVEPGTFPLAHGIPGRVGRLRAYGNAIVPQVAAEFIRAAS